MKKIALLLFAVLLVTGTYAQTTIEFWHAMTGKNGDMVNAIAEKVNYHHQRWWLEDEWPLKEAILFRVLLLC